MNAILYHSNKHKKINGTLFYCFEYFVYLKKSLPNLKYILLNTSDEDLEWFKSIFIEKYNFDESFLNDIINLEKLVTFVNLNVENLMILDIHSYNIVKDFTGKVKNVFVYSNESHNYVDKKDNHQFYGFYDYQNFNYKTRIKLYKDIHKTFEKHGNKIFISSLNPDLNLMISKLKLNREDVFVKEMNSHNKNLFESIYKLIYWHSGNADTNNRALPEAVIHDLELEVHLNGYENDSIKERYNLIKTGKESELWLDDSDILLKDFLDVCKN